MVSRSLCQEVLSRAMSTGADFAEIFCQNTAVHAVSLVSKKVDSISDSTICGAGIRVFKGLRSVTASTVDMSRAGLLRCAASAAAALGEGNEQREINLRERILPNPHGTAVVPGSAGNGPRTYLVRKAAEAAYAVSPGIVQVRAGLGDWDRRILVANSEGLYARDRQIRTRLFCTAIAEKNGETQSGSANVGRLMGLEIFDQYDPAEIGRQAAEQAVVMASAGYCPAGVMPVAIGNGFGGVIFHEACGHSLEASSVAIGMSEFSGKLGQVIANEKVTAIDDGTIPGAWGSITMDDEGTPSRKNVLIEKGVLKGYMIDRMGSRRMGMEPTGSARREDYTYTTTSRMTNTYIAAGEDRAEDIIASMDLGLYAKSMGGGSVNPATGQFNFAVSEGYIVRNGRICEPVRGASLVGRGSEVIMKIDMVSSDLELGAGNCGSSSGSVPVNVGQPLIRVSSITVGGR
ncbi:MAG: TldD/PmbA family protein [Oscillospiraceae bacterium]|nr:TldD/PmbA family protein [Oscillospiraceae bacterium]